MNLPSDNPKSGSGPLQGAAVPAALLSEDLEVVTSATVQAAAAERSSDDQQTRPLVALLSSAAAFSLYSSMTFHLAIWATALVVLPLFGFDVLEMLTFEDRPLQAALGDEEVLDGAAFVETADNLNSANLQSPSTLEQMAKQLQQAENAWLRSSAEDVFAAMTGQQDPGAEASDLGGLLRIPVDGLAVTKGSFTAFTIPASPQPRQAYSIVIEVKLPDDVKKYRVSDLSGKVRGTDGYEQRLPYDTRTPGASGYPVPGGSIKRLEPSTILDVVKNKVQLVIRVPGGARLVKDVITIRSRRLKEDQELELVFGQARD